MRLQEHSIHLNVAGGECFDGAGGSVAGGARVERAHDVSSRRALDVQQGGRGRPDTLAKSGRDTRLVGMETQHGTRYEKR